MSYNFHSQKVENCTAWADILWNVYCKFNSL